jgi:octanoyl-[GcvH]:protein N-octanoyltransferase
VRRLRVLSDSFPDDPALDTAVSEATMRRVAAGELPETLRLARPARVVAFAKRDALAGGRAAVFHEGTLELAHAVPDPDPRPGIHARFEATAGLVARALARLGVDARVGEVPGEYCPGRWSVNAGGARKLAGIGQRVISGGAHVGTVIVVDDAAAVRTVLEPVYAALGLGWDPATVGAVERPWAAVREAVLAEFSERYELVEDGLDAETLELAQALVNGSNKGPPADRGP